jgi:division protein CdvB (Snf7/Vps24/ESCRT-III family)
MTVTMDSIDNKVATLKPMLANLDSMDGAIQSMTYATHNMGRSTQYMQTDISRMNHNIGRPMSFMNAFMPW